MKHKIGGGAKAMVVTSSRLHAVRYRQAFGRYLDEKGYKDIRVLVAFSGEVEDPDILGEKFTEVGMNAGIRERELPERSVAQIMPFVDPDLEKLYTFGRFLELKLPQDPKKAPLKLDAETALTYYRLDRMGVGRIALKPGEESALTAAGEAGMKRSAPEEARLSEVIEVLNDRFGTEFTEADQLFFDSVIAEAKADAQVQQRPAANSLDNFSLAMKSRLRDAIVDRMDRNETIATRYLNDQEFESVTSRELLRRIYEELRTKAAKDEMSG